VVHISLYVAEHGGLTLIGDSKRKSIHVPPSSNAYWNFVGLRSALVQYFTREGIQRPLRTWLMKELRTIVEAVHRYELMATYDNNDPEFQSVQYYDVVLYPTDYLLSLQGNLGEDDMLKGHDLMFAAAYASRDYQGSVEPGSQLFIDGVYGMVVIS
jgi:hypothetical protein